MASYSWPAGGSGGGGGSVTSVGLVAPSSVFDVTGSPVTAAGDLILSFINQSPNTIFAGPSAGGANTPQFRALVVADIPNLPASIITSGKGSISTSTAGVTIGSGANSTLGPNVTVDLTLGNLTDVGTDGIVITGGTGVVIGSGTSIAQHVADSTHNGYLSSTDWSTFNNKQAALSFGNLTDVGTDGITITGGTGAVIGSGTSISQHVADSTHNGYLSQTDWSTFNSKGTGSVTSVTFTGDGTVLSSTPSSAVTTTGTLTASLNNQSANTFLAGPVSGGAAAPTFRALAPQDFTAPTVQKFLTGSGTYTTPAGVLYLHVRMVGAGGGGSGGGTGTPGSGSDGTDTTFGTTLLVAGKGFGAAGNAGSGGFGGVGGTASLGTGPVGLAFSGGSGNPGINNNASSVVPCGGAGASSAVGGQGGGGAPGANGYDAGANTGSGGGGGAGAGSFPTGGGGGAGGYVDAFLYSPDPTYSYAVGVGGAFGAGDVGGLNGGAGADGFIIVEEYYQ